MTVRARMLPPLVGLAILVLPAALVGESGASASSAPGTLDGRGARPVAGAVVAAPSAGTPGIGDAYFDRDGNGGIDVLHYGIHDRYAFGSGQLTGRTKLTVRAVQDLSRFNLDFLLPVSRVRVDGVLATHRRIGDHELQITPTETLVSGREFDVVVEYAGRPANLSSQGESNWLADATEVVTMNEPHMATWWFPANDHPRDKASFDVTITVPKAKQVVSNGVLVDRRPVGEELTATHWRSTEPMVPYLAFFAAGAFNVREGSYQGRPWYVAVSRQIPPAQRADVMSLMVRSGEITAWLESALGAYPFGTTGGLVTGLPVGFALETQTRPTYPQVSSSAVSLVVHELAHQWFGDSVSVDRWRDVWLNEGFATFMEVYYAETRGGRTSRQWLQDTYTGRLPIGTFWTLRIDDPGPDHLFDDPIYTRGAMTLAALRQRVGDVDYWAILRGWVEQQRYGNATTAEFEQLAESASGEDLDSFFQAWLRTPSPPAKTAENGLD